jgi:hypothetical protein
MWVSAKYYLKLVEGGTPRGFWSNRTGASGGGGSLESTPGGHRQSRAMLSKKQELPSTAAASPRKFTHFSRLHTIQIQRKYLGIQPLILCMKGY